MKEEVYIERLFADYADSPELREFKEEIATNFRERIQGLRLQGAGEEEAFEKAAVELGDITAIADEVGKRKRNETIGHMYMGGKVPLTSKTAGGLAVASGVLLLGLGAALFAFFAKTDSTWPFYIAVASVSVASGLYAYFGLTQETAAHYSMKNGRALAYGGACLLGLWGLGFSAVSFGVDGFEISVALGVHMAGTLLAVCALIFLLATENKRQKPWLSALIRHEIENAMQVDSMKAAKFGLNSGGLWILTVALFVTLGFTLGWQYAWLIFLFAFAIQVFMVTTLFEKKP